MIPLDLKDVIVTQMEDNGEKPWMKQWGKNNYFWSYDYTYRKVHLLMSFT